MKNVTLALALGTFAVFFANVGLGAMRRDVFLSDIAEMLVLLAACVFFVVSILLHESDRLASARARSETGRNGK